MNFGIILYPIKVVVSLFRKPKLNVGHWYYVDFSEAAKEYSVGNDFCKKIHTMYNNEFTGEVQQYSEAKITVIKQNNGVVIDSTIGQEVPNISVPKAEAAFGVIQLHSRMG